jgi:predicted ATPase
MMVPLWRIALFDGLRLVDAEQTDVRRFRSQRVAALLAYLALHLGRDVPRETLAEALWPEQEPKVTANRLRVSLTSLRRQLEPRGVSAGSVLDTSRVGFVRLRREAVWCDVVAFEDALRAGRCEEAAALAPAPLLPGFYDEWILTERERLEALRAPLPSVPHATAALPEPSVERAASPHRLPLYLTRFIGRERERETLARLLAENRLVTLVASGGMGKTRLAVETACAAPRPALCVPLADLTDAERLTEAVLHALDIRGRVDTEPTDALVAALTRRGPLLLLLDNAEHLVEAVAELAWSLLEAVPTLGILVTSRQSLGLPGEALLPLTPLMPPPVSGSVSQLVEFPAIALFLDRARALQPDYVLIERHAAALVALCQRLEGIPLALELAAARIHLQTPTQILASLEERPTELRSHQRALPPRHRSLRALVESSLDLLTLDLQAAFAALSVFQGGWTADAAAAILKPASGDDPLWELLARSLIVRCPDDDDRADTARFTLLETLRRFGDERLTGDRRAQGKRRHAAYFLALLSCADEHDVRTLAPIDNDLENVLAALDHGWVAPDGAFWDGLTGFLTFAFVRGHHRRAAAWAERASETWRSVEPPERRFELLHRTLMVFVDSGRWDAVDALAEALHTDAERHGKARWEIEARMHRSYIASQRSDHEEAARLQRTALAAARALGEQRTLVRTLVLTNRVLNPYAHALAQSDPDRSRALWQEAEAASREALARVEPHSRYQASIAIGLFLSVGGQGNLRDAYDLLKQGQRWAWQHRSLALLMYSFYYEHEIESAHGSSERAALLLGAFSRLREQMGYAHPFSEEEERGRQRLRERVSPEVYARQFRLAHRLSLEELLKIDTPSPTPIAGEPR